MKLLLDRNEVNPDSRSNYNNTPLLCAAQCGQEGIVKLLLDRKEVNLNSKNNDGRTPLDYAAAIGHEGIVKLLQDRADPESCTGANNASMPPSHPLENSFEGLAVSQLSPSPPGVAPDMLTKNTYAALSSAASPETHDTSSETSPQATPLDFPPLALLNPGSHTAIAAAGIAAVVAILAITIRWWL